MNPRKKRHLKMAANVRDVYRQVDAHVTSSAEFEGVSCKKGCAACCRMMTVTTFPEAVALASRYPKEVERALPRLREDHATMLDIGRAQAVPMNTPHMLDPELHQRLCDAWWELQRPCPFLSDANECTVYEARPLACRTYYVRSDPSLCARVPAAGVEFLALSDENSPRAIGALADAQERAGLSQMFMCGNLAEMVLYARQQLRR